MNFIRTLLFQISYPGGTFSGKDFQCLNAGCIKEGDNAPKNRSANCNFK